MFSAENAVNAGLTGPVLRSTGVDCDIRKVDSYWIYDRFSFRIPLREHGDTYDRTMLRLLEMREFLKILQTAPNDLPEGSILDPKAKLRNLRPRILSHKRQNRPALPLPGASTQPHQPHASGGDVHRPPSASQKRTTRSRSFLIGCGYSYPTSTSAVSRLKANWRIASQRSPGIAAPLI